MNIRELTTKEITEIIRLSDLTDDSRKQHNARVDELGKYKKELEIKYFHGVVSSKYDEYLDIRFAENFKFITASVVSL